MSTGALKLGAVRDTLRLILGEINGAIAICTSAGIDSSALVVSALDLGKSVTVVSFSLEDRRSTDFQGARRLAHEFKLPFLPVNLPLNPDRIVKDVSTLILRWKVEKKTGVECLWPFVHVFEQLKANGLQTLVTGSAADGHFALSKKAMIHFRYPKERFQVFRRTYFSNPDSAQCRTLKRIGAGEGIKVVAPYFDPRMFALFSDSSWDDLNKPRQKEAIRRDFPELDCFHIPRHSNLQLGDSGIADTVGETVRSRFTPRAKSPISAYNIIAKLR